MTLEIVHLDKAYEYFYRVLYKEEKYVFRPTQNTDKVAQKFLLEIEKKFNSFSINSFTNYLNYQFNYWERLILQNDKRINYTFLFGDKSLTRFLERKIEFDYQFEYTLLKKSIITSWFTVPKEVTNYNNPIRLRFLNTEEGFVHCIQQTTLYDPRDSSCIKCIHKESCKKLLKQNYPKLFKNRNVKTSIK